MMKINLEVCECVCVGLFLQARINFFPGRVDKLSYSFSICSKPLQLDLLYSLLDEVYSSADCKKAWDLALLV